MCRGASSYLNISIIKKHPVKVRNEPICIRCTLSIKWKLSEFVTLPVTTIQWIVDVIHSTIMQQTWLHHCSFFQCVMERSVLQILDITRSPGDRKHKIYWITANIMIMAFGVYFVNQSLAFQ